MPYIQDISLLDSTKNVNDTNINAPLEQLNNNIDHVVSLVNGNDTLLPILFGNLLDYNADGVKFLSNGGSFNKYINCHAWSAIRQFRVTNELDIAFDGSRFIYKRVNTNTSAPAEDWIEREIYIPRQLRGQQLTFSIKAAGCTNLTAWTSSIAVKERIGIQIVGATDTIEEFYNVDNWADFAKYTDSTQTPSMTTIHVPFTVSATTESVRIKIYRTAATGYLHIDKIYVGALKLPYDNTRATQYKLINVDINELYDFVKNQPRVVSDAVLGHKVPAQPIRTGNTAVISGCNISDLVTYEGLFQVTKDLFTSSVSTSANLSAYGITTCNIGQQVYTVSHATVKNNNVSIPMITIGGPPILSTFISGMVYDVQQDNFKVYLASAPLISGYFINWHLPNVTPSLALINNLPIPTTTTNNITSGNAIIFSYETISLDG